MMTKKVEKDDDFVASFVCFLIPVSTGMWCSCLIKEAKKSLWRMICYGDGQLLRLFTNWMQSDSVLHSAEKSVMHSLV